MLRLTPTPPEPVAVLRKDGVRTQENLLKTHSTQALMTLAGESAARLAMAHAPHARRIWIAAGPGNNGGDGLQAACFLHQWGMPVRVSLMGSPEDLPPDAQDAWRNAINAGVRIDKQLPDQWIAEMTPQDLCIDALLGMGSNRAPASEMQDWIERMNLCAARILALDLPTGLEADSGQVLGGAPTQRHVVHADLTLTLVAAKPGLFMGHGRDVCGNIWLDRLTRACSGDLPARPSDAWLNLPWPGQHKHHASHKGSHGDVAIIGGEPMALHGMGMTGAALLAAQAALHGGAGRVILSLLGARTENPSAAADIMQRAFEQLDLSHLTVVAGCGGGQAIRSVLSDILRHSARLVLDADGLNAVAENAEWRARLCARGDAPDRATVITPHPLEAARLLGCTVQTVQQDRLLAAQTLSQQLQCTVVLKGSGSVIASPGEPLCINTSGNGLLAIGGTGDVLAGLTGSRLAQGLTPHRAACAATWQHGVIADHWPSGEALTASRLAERLR
jgi:hydroxyethylthiazole kinase-like uncharacterized protein yjeF